MLIDCILFEIANSSSKVLVTNDLYANSYLLQRKYYINVHFSRRPNNVTFESAFTRDCSTFPSMKDIIDNKDDRDGFIGLPGPRIWPGKHSIYQLFLVTYIKVKGLWRDLDKK